MEKNNELEVINLEKTNDEKISKIEKLGNIGLSVVGFAGSGYISLTTCSMLIMEDLSSIYQIGLGIPTLASFYGAIIFVKRIFENKKVEYQQSEENDEKENSDEILEIKDIDNIKSSKVDKLKEFGNYTWNISKTLAATYSIASILTLIKNMPNNFELYQTIGLFAALMPNSILLNNSIDNFKEKTKQKIKKINYKKVNQKNEK